MDSYRFLAEYYDVFTEDVPYKKWVNFFEEIFKREQLSPKLVLDMACGTGSIVKIMADRGYEMIGTDSSVEMLFKAQTKTIDTDIKPLFLNQSMTELDLFGTVDACVCCLDSINYITQKNDLKTALYKVHLFLEPDGIFIFDINTEKKFQDMNEECYIRETENVFCVWQVSVDNNLCTYDFDIFERSKHNSFYRQQETHTERVYSITEIKECLREIGFIDIKTYPELSFGEITGNEDRLFFTARKRK